MDYISAPEAAKNWGISERRVQKSFAKKTVYRELSALAGFG